jgi:8-oxo-dGTP pyrophosphatase MutT (NUDIX family)
VTRGRHDTSTVPLPGWLLPLAEAAPRAVADQLSRFAVPADGTGRPSAVLVLFGDGDGDIDAPIGGSPAEPGAEGPAGPDVLLIQKAADLRSHAGQPAFPGGSLEPADTGPVTAALREAAEETGLDPAGVEVFAELPELWLPHSGYRVTPVLAWWRQPGPVHAADPGEVQSVHRVPIAELVDPANRLLVRHPSGFVGPAFAVRGLVVWGFTAGLLDKILALGGWARPWDPSRIEPLADPS